MNVLPSLCEGHVNHTARDETTMKVKTRSPPAVPQDAGAGQSHVCLEKVGELRWTGLPTLAIAPSWAPGLDPCRLIWGAMQPQSRDKNFPTKGRVVQGQNRF